MEKYHALKLQKTETGVLKIPVKVEGKYKERFLIDSGSDVSMISLQGLTAHKLDSRISKTHPQGHDIRWMDENFLDGFITLKVKISGLVQEIVFVVSTAGENLLGMDYLSEHQAIGCFSTTEDLLLVSREPRPLKPRKETLIFREVSIFSKRIRTLLDTGASASHISNKLVPWEVMKKGRTQIMQVNSIGSSEESELRIFPPQPLEIDGETLVCPELWSYVNQDLQYPAVLGIDFLQLNNATVDFRKKRVHFYQCVFK